MTDIDIRWKQRLENFQKAYSQLDEAVELSKTRKLSRLEKQGLIQGFEYTHELAWNTLKDFFTLQGNNKIAGPRDATREAFKNDLIINGEAWMDMILSRNLTSHTYNPETADLIVDKTVSVYLGLFFELISELKTRK